MEPLYSVGEHIEALDIDARHAGWRPAIVLKLAPYRGKPGYYISWSDLAPAERWMPRPSAGGWTYEGCMRKIR